MAGLFAAGCRRRPENPPAGESAPSPLEVPVGSPLPVHEPMMRIRIHRVRDRAAEIRLDTRGGRILANHLAYGGRGLEFVAPLVIRSDVRGWLIEEANGRITKAEGVGEVVFTDSESGSIELLPRDRHYPGALHLSWRSDVGPGAFDVVNHVALESYLPGVLASELFSHWHVETFKAQAIAARSFASSEHAYFESRRHYDVTDTVSSQVYAGEVDLGKASVATRATRGVVLEYETRLVPGYYSSCCGGIAARAVDVIGSNPINAIKPLDGRGEHDVCTDAPVYEWVVRRSVDRLARRIAAYGERRGNEPLAMLERIQAFEVMESNRHGRPTRYRIVPAEGEPVELGAESLMRAMNHSNDDMDAPEDSLRSSFIEVESAGNEFVITGHGFGHGAGLCQYGAQALAKQGRSFIDILVWYYPGAELFSAYS